MDLTGSDGCTRKMYRQRNGRLQYGVPVRRRTRNHLRGDIAAAAGMIFHHRLLTQHLAQALRHNASQRIGTAARRSADDVSYGFCRVVLRPAIVRKLADQTHQHQ